MKRIIVFLFLWLLFLTVAYAHAAEYDAKSPLRVKKVQFCEDKPKGMGHFDLRESNQFKKGNDTVYIYIEVANCKSEKEEKYYHIRLAMDVAIYYQDGICIFNREEANTFDYQSLRKDTDAYIWTRIDATYLKEGEYKVEMTIRDENSDKETFALTRFKRL